MMEKSHRMGWLLALTLILSAAPVTHAQKNQSWQNRTLIGHVFNAQDQALPKAVVYLKNTKSLAIRTYISDPDGGYHFPSLSPNVDYEVYAEYQGAHSDTKTLSAFDSRKQAEITLHVK